MTVILDTGEIEEVFDVSGDKDKITLALSDDPSTSYTMVINELASTYLEYTVAYGFATGFGKEEPYSVKGAMADDTSVVYVVLKCMDTVSDKLCNFASVKPPQARLENPEIIEVADLAVADVSADGFSVCNKRTAKCEPCHTCASGLGCVETAECEKDCKTAPPSEYLYGCDLAASLCSQKEDGTFDIDYCKVRCNGGEGDFGKCDFTTEQCVAC